MTGASMIAGGSDLEVDRDSFLIRDRPHHEHGADSVEMETLQRADQTEPNVSNDDTDEARISIAESSEQTLAPIVALPPNLSDVGGHGLAMIDISKVTTTKVLDKRSSSLGVELVGSRVQVRARTAMVGCRFGGKGADETRSHLELREWIRMNGMS